MMIRRVGKPDAVGDELIMVRPGRQLNLHAPSTAPVAVHRDVGRIPIIELACEKDRFRFGFVKDQSDALRASGAGHFSQLAVRFRNVNG